MTVSQEARTLHNSATVIDLHCHPTVPMYLFNRRFYGGHTTSSPDFNLFKMLTQMGTNLERLQAGGLDAICSAVYVPERGLLDTCFLLHLASPLIHHFHDIVHNDPFRTAGQIIDMMEAKIAGAASLGANVGRARSYQELVSMIQAGKIAVIHALEGAHMLGRDLQNPQSYFDRLDYFIDRGCAYLTLAHFFTNNVTHSVEGFAPEILKSGCFHQSHDDAAGLGNIGTQVVERMLERGIIVDLTHSTTTTRRDVFAINNAAPRKRPIVFTHVGVRHFCPELMAPNDEEIRAIAECNGVIGIISMNYWLTGNESLKNGLDKIIATIRYISDLVGIEHVAVGTDFDGFTNPCDDFYDSSMLPHLTQALMNAHFSEDEIRKVLGLNAMRVLRDGWGNNP